MGKYVYENFYPCLFLRLLSGLRTAIYTLSALVIHILYEVHVCTLNTTDNNVYILIGSCQKLILCSRAFMWYDIGFPSLGVLLQKLENPALRACLKVSSNEVFFVGQVKNFAC